MASLNRLVETRLLRHLLALGLAMLLASSCMQDDPFLPEIDEQEEAEHEEEEEEGEGEGEEQEGEDEGGAGPLHSVRIVIHAERQYLLPGESATFTVLGFDSVGVAVPVPDTLTVVSAEPAIVSLDGDRIVAEARGITRLNVPAFGWLARSAPIVVYDEQGFGPHLLLTYVTGTFQYVHEFTFGKRGAFSFVRWMKSGPSVHHGFSLWSGSTSFSRGGLSSAGGAVGPPDGTQWVRLENEVVVISDGQEVARFPTFDVRDWAMRPDGSVVAVRADGSITAFTQTGGALWQGPGGGLRILATSTTDFRTFTQDSAWAHEADGTLRWTVPRGAHRAVVDDAGTTYLESIDGTRITAVSAAGEILWESGDAVGSEAWPDHLQHGLFVTAGGLLISSRRGPDSFSHAVVTARDTHSGLPQWTRSTRCGIVATAADGRLFLAEGASNSSAIQLHQISSSSGAALLSAPPFGSESYGGGCPRAVAAVDGSVFVGTNSGLHRLDVGN